MTKLPTLSLFFNHTTIYHFPLSLEFGSTPLENWDQLEFWEHVFLRNREQIGFRVHKNRGFGIMLPHPKLTLELGSCLLLLRAQKFGNRDIVIAHLLTYLLIYLLTYVKHNILSMQVATKISY